jgi:Domain of unknown function (DUF4352)
VSHSRQPGGRQRHYGQPPQNNYPPPGNGYPPPQADNPPYGGGHPQQPRPGYPPQQGHPPPGGGYYQQPPPPQPPGRKRHIVRNAVIGVAGLIVVIIVVAALAHGGSTPSVSTNPTPPPTAASGSAGQATGAPAAATVAHVGSTISLAGNSPGEKMAVTVMKVIPRAQGSDEFNTPDPGNRFYAVQFRLTDTGSIAYSDSPSNGAQVVDSTGQSYQSDLSTVAGCQSFPGTENIAVGSTGLGCVVFQVPRHAKITEIQFTLDSGFANQTGQWKV